MSELTLEEALAELARGGGLSGRIAEAGVECVFDPEHPYLCTAIHDGGGFAADLEPWTLIPAAERIYEEDPHTGELIEGLPNHIKGLDSRYEYDLNRPPSQAVYDLAWGREVWRAGFPDALRQRALAKHAAFYQLFDAMVMALVRRHGACVIYDVHSYNGLRKGGASAPEFNIGTAQVNMRRHRRTCEHLGRMLSAIPVDGESPRAVFNEVFYGLGYLATRCKMLTPKALCIPLEIRKFFCDEDTGAPYPQVLAALKLSMTRAIAENAAYFWSSLELAAPVRRSAMLPSEIDQPVLDLDRKLYALTGKLETLLYINPINLDQQRAIFFARKGRYEPQFKYRKLELDPFLFKESIYRLPVQNIRDASLQALYRRAVEGLSAEIDIIATIGGRQCLYNSLRYYGEPNLSDLENARFLLHAPEIGPDGDDGPQLTDAEVVRAIEAEVDRYRIAAPVQLSNRIAAGAMVDNANFRVLVRKGARQSRLAVDALRHHEIGVHLLSSAQARRQPLRLFRLGLPGSTETQEGLAVLAEHLSGNLSIQRLKTLGLRVVAVRALIDGFSFSRTFDLLVEQYGASQDTAFIVTARVFRGGGFTKDYLYLRGLARAFAHWRAGQSWDPLMIGKTAFEDAGLVEELLARQLLVRPNVLPDPFARPATTEPILDYLLGGLKVRVQSQ